MSNTSGLMSAAQEGGDYETEQDGVQHTTAISYALWSHVIQPMPALL